MIRRLVKRALRRVAGRPERPAAPPAPRRPPPPPPEPEPPQVDPEIQVDLEIEGEDLRAWVDEGRAPLLLDVRELHEVQGGYAEGSFLLPMNQVPDRLTELPTDRSIVVVCAAGARSFGVAHYLREQGLEDAWSLSGGVGAWFAEGGQRVAPHRGGAFSLLTPVRLKPEAAAQRALPERERGLKATVQAVDEVPEGLRYALQVALPEGGSQRIEGVSEEEIEAIARARRSPS